MQMNATAMKVGVGLAATRPPGVFSTAALVVRTQGPTGLYKGLSAALMRQATYSATRFAAYDFFKLYLEQVLMS